MVEIFKNGKCVARSQNLRGIRDYARRHGIAKVIIVERKCAEHTEFGGTLNILFGDGATVKTGFRSYGVLEAWVTARRSWGLVDAGRASLQSFNLRYFNGPAARFLR